MISSLKSGFNAAPRRAVLLGAEGLAVYHWDGGALETSWLFEISPAGRRFFGRYLEATPRIPTYFLVDLLEEEYRQETMPHVFGVDRWALISRKKSRLFRDTPYIHVAIQGREDGGRRDDRVMFTALTHPHLLAPWISLLEANGIPLSGIYSLAHLTASVLDLIPGASDHLLITSVQGISGLRQTYFHRREFRFSRLAGMPCSGCESWAPYILGETEVLRRYLDSVRLAGAADPLDVYYLSDRPLLAALENTVRDTARLRHHCLDLESIGRAAGLAKTITGPFSDQFFCYLLLKRRPANLYAQKSEMHRYRMQKARHVMNAASVLTVLMGLLFGGLNFTAGVLYREQAIAARKQADFYGARYEAARGGWPQAALSPAELREITDIARALGKLMAMPDAMLETISLGLEEYPHISIDEIDWSTGTYPASALAGTGAPPEVPLAPAAAGHHYYHAARVNGRVDPFDGDYREALAMIEGFTETLRGLSYVHEAAIVTRPAGFDPETILQGGSHTGPAHAGFSLQIVMGIPHESRGH